MRRRVLSAIVMALSMAYGWAATAWAVTETTTLSRVEGVRIEQPSMIVYLPLASSGPPVDRLKTVLAEPATWNPTDLVLEDIRFDAPPGVLFDMFLSIPGREVDRQYVGTLSLAEPERSRTFEVALKLKKLRNERSELPELQLMFEASLGTDDPTLTFKDAQERFNREAGLRVGSVVLRVRDEP